MKVKVWCLCKSQQAFKGCSLFLWVLRHGTVWHLAFPQASNGDSVCCLCPRNTLFICYCLSYASLPFTKLLPSQGNDGKLTYLHWCQMLFWLCGMCGLNTNTHAFSHRPANHFQSVFAACFRYEGTGGCIWQNSLFSQPMEVGCKVLFKLHSLALSLKQRDELHKKGN